MKHSSKKAWAMIKKLSGDPRKPGGHINVTPDKITSVLLLHGKTMSPGGRTCQHIKRSRSSESQEGTRPFTAVEMSDAILNMRRGKACGIDDLTVEQIKQFGPITMNWLLPLFNNIMLRHQIPKIWCRTRVVALLKPSKEPTDPKSFRPISVLCHLYKLFDRMLLHRVTAMADTKLIREQAGFRPGSSCTGQILNLTQHIEDGFESRKVTGVAFVDLTAAYDTVNHKLLLYKLYKIAKDYGLVDMIIVLLATLA